MTLADNRHTANPSSNSYEPGRHPPFSSLTVLVVDDQPLLREAVAFEFEMLGCETLQAENGEKGLEVFKQNKVDVIISDIRMPIWDGTRFLEELRKISPNQPPFIFMTGYADLQPSQAYQRGADAFLGKPIYPDSLYEVLRRITAPLDLRWKKKPDAVPPITIKADFSALKSEPLNHHFQLGRGGFFIAAQHVTSIPHVQDLRVGFDLAFAPATSLPPLQGVGYIRWVRGSGYEGFIQGYGIEFEYLEPASYKALLTLIKSSSLLAFIPEGKKIS